VPDAVAAYTFIVFSPCRGVFERKLPVTVSGSFACVAFLMVHARSITRVSDIRIQSPHKLLAAIGLMTVATLAQAQTVLPNSTANAIKMPAIPEGKETDVKFYAANGDGVVMGRDAFDQMPKAKLVLWLAGNQFFAMDDVIGAFQKHDPAISVGLITLPPGLLLQDHVAIHHRGRLELLEIARGCAHFHAQSDQRRCHAVLHPQGA
jgi:hypothetical protein